MPTIDVGQAHVHENEFEMMLLDQIQRLCAVLGLIGHEPFVQLQLFGQRNAQGLVVIDDQGLFTAGHLHFPTRGGAAIGAPSRRFPATITRSRIGEGQVGAPPSLIWRAMAWTSGASGSDRLMTMPK